jgi:acetate kinase
MKALVANIGSTSFKWRLYAMEDESVLAEGRAERIGGKGGEFPDHASAIGDCLGRLTGAGGPLKGLGDLGVVGFKAVHAKGISGSRLVDESVLGAMEEYSPLLPAHNPPYIKAMRAFGKSAPGVPLVAVFETAFFEGMTEEVSSYAVPRSWAREEGFRRYGFHGASHRWAAERALALCSQPGLRHISCHLGGSSSLAAIRAGQAVNTSFGMTPQCGLAQSNRVGDVDVFAVFHMMRLKGWGVEEVSRVLATESGLAGLSGTGGDMRDIWLAIESGSADAKLAVQVFVNDIRRYLGAFMVQLGGVDCITFSGGIGEKDGQVRAMALEGLDEFGIRLDPARNGASGVEARISADDSRVRVFTVKTNEELVVARAASEAAAARGSKEN